MSVQEIAMSRLPQHMEANTSDLLDENSLVGNFVAKNPAFAALFEKLGIDYCCKGKKSLKELCSEKGYDVAVVLQQLNEIATLEPPRFNWEDLSTDALIDHIVHAHHAYLKQELPRLSRLIEKVAGKHGERHPELYQLQETFEKFSADMLTHLQKEENFIFPAIQLGSHKEALIASLAQLDAEHVEEGAYLERMHQLTNGYVPPPGACMSYRVMLNGLAQLERDMHTHVHKETHILFQRVARI